MLSRVIAALHRWAESGWAGSATATWEFCQSAVVPGPSGAVFAPLALADPPRAPRLAMWATAGAVAGGCIAYLIGAEALEGLAKPIFSALGVSPATLTASEVMFERHGWVIVFLSTISPLSTKLTAIAAGAFGLPFVQFFPALAVGRAVRFAALTVILRFAGERLWARLRRRERREPSKS
jgi:membrane protein YqaA with SNARE-associated domain